MLQQFKCQNRIFTHIIAESYFVREITGPEEGRTN